MRIAIKILFAKWHRFWHCLFHLHRAVTIRAPRHGTIEISCECGKCWYVDYSYLEPRQFGDS